MNNRLVFDPDVTLNQENNHILVKKIIQQKYDEQNQHFNPQKNVNLLLKKNATAIDDILTLCWNHFLKQYATEISLIATGGYGREELFPHSDIDILILLKSSATSAFQDNLSTFSNFLWDIGLKPGQSVRTITECIHLATDEQTILTSLLEMRFITGSQSLFSELQQTFIPKELWSSSDYFAAKMQEQERRYTKYHDTAYNLEPNIKEGPGGLRDLQNIAWVFKHRYDSSSLKELIEYDLFSEKEYEDLINCRNILWRIRFALHVLTERSEDRILFDYQRELALEFGFTDENNTPDVEQFMQYYFKTVMELERMNEMLLQFFNEQLSLSNTSQELHPVNNHFVSINGYLETKEKDTFSKYPLTLLEIFPLLQKNPSIKGVRATTVRLIRQNLHLIDDSFRNNARANELFLSILKSSRGITQQLRQMNKYGVLAAYLPDFAHIVARMQYDLFHIYTVDAHTLFVLRNLRRFSLEKHCDEVPFCSSIFFRIKKPYILYITALFHDIAKGMGGDHSVLGEKIAHQFCIQHKLSRYYTRLVTWLVRNHLVMSMTAQRKDISDPEIIHEFASLVGSVEYLDHLYLFTVADIRATNPSLWNSWKNTLLINLYSQTLSVIRRGLQNPVAKNERVIEAKQEAKEELTTLGISESKINVTWEQFSDDYFLRYSPDEISWHTITIASTAKKDLPLVTLRPQNERGSVEIFIYAKNANDIFSVSADTLDQLGLSILDARIVTITPSTSSEQYIFNSFQVLEQSGEPIIDLDRELRICKTLRDNLQNHSAKQCRNINRQSRQAKHFPITSRINFLQDPLNRYTIIELITTDRPGLIAIVGRAFSELSIQLHDAKITTIGSRVEDIFQITDNQLQPISNKSRQKIIQEKLISIIDQKEKKMSF